MYDLKNKVLCEYKLGKVIGEGAFSKVRIGHHAESGVKVAVKVIDKKQQEEKSKKAAERAAELDKKRKEKKMREAEQQKWEEASLAIQMEKSKSKFKEGIEADRLPNSIETAIPSNHSEQVKPIEAQTMQHEQGNKGIGGSIVGHISVLVNRASSQNQAMSEAEARMREIETITSTDESLAKKMELSEVHTLSSQKRPDGPSLYGNLTQEVRLLMRLNHPNIIRIYQVVESEEELHVVMEYAEGGELVDYIASRDKLSEKEARKFFRQMISALDHSHLAGVVHRDLKLENLLLNDKRDILVSDFGLGRTFIGENDVLKTFCGTPNYAAIELISGIPYNGPKADIWSMGIVLFFMTTGKPPFKGQTINSLYSKIKSLSYHIPSYISPELTNLFRQIFVKDPSERIDMDNLRSHPWVNSEYDEQPIRIYPRTSFEDRDSSDVIARDILGISIQNGYTIYSFHAYKDQMAPRVTSGRFSFSKLWKRSSKREPQLEDVVEDKLEHVNNYLVSIRSYSEAVPEMSKRRPHSASAVITGLDHAEIQKINASGERNHMRQASSIIESRQLSSIDGRKDSLISINPLDTIRKNRRASLATPGLSRANTERRTSVALPRSLSMSRRTSITPSMRKQSVLNEFDLMTATNDRTFRRIASELQEPLNEAEALKQVEDFHKLHKPAPELRTMRFSITQNTLSALSAVETFVELHRALVELQRTNEGKLEFHRVDPFYLFNCTFVHGAEEAELETVNFEVELCKVAILKVLGLRVKRIHGSALMFKELNKKLTNSFKQSCNMWIP